MSTFIQRYTARERSNHWIVAIAFVLAALSGLALPVVGQAVGTGTRIEKDDAQFFFQGDDPF